MNLFNMLKNLIKNGKQTKVMDDTNDIPKAQNQFMGQVKNIKHVTPYGLYSSPVLDSQWLIFSSRSNPDDLQGIANDYKHRPKLLLEGEVVIQNLKTGAFTKFDALGNIISYATASITETSVVSNNTVAPVITGTATTNISETAPIILNTATTSMGVTSPITTFTGNVNITGTLTVNGIEFSSHVHKENDVPNDTDGPKNP